MRAVVGACVSARLPVIGSWVTSQQPDNTTMGAGRLAAFNPSDANAVAAVTRIIVPIFSDHGQEDRAMPVDDVRERARRRLPGHPPDRRWRRPRCDDASEHEPLESESRTWIPERLQERRISP